MQVRCPQCHTSIDLASDSQLADITCSSCGSSFSLLGGDQTATYDAGQTKTIGHFELIEQLGVGTFGFVWRAKDTQLDRTVAIKIPRKGQLDPDETEQFLREARAAAQLRHPNIVSVHEVGRDEDAVYIVSDFVEGVTLADRLTAQTFSVKEAAGKSQQNKSDSYFEGILNRSALWRCPTMSPYWHPAINKAPCSYGVQPRKKKYEVLANGGSSLNRNDRRQRGVLPQFS